MATLKQQIESHIPYIIQAPDTDKFLSWIREIQYILVHIVDETDALTHVKPYTVTTDGLSIDLMRHVTPYKNGITAGMYWKVPKELLDNANYDGIYKPTANHPAAIIHDGKIYIYPGGGTITGFGPVAVANLDGSDISGMPMPFKVACIYYVAIQAYKELITTENNTKAVTTAPVIPDLTLAIPELTISTFNAALTQQAIPGAPADPVINADAAGEPSVSSPTLTSPDLTSGATGEIYQKENPTLSFSTATDLRIADDIEMLNGEIAILQKNLELANQKMSDELNRVNTLIAGFQSKVQHSLEQGRLTLSASDSQAQLRLNRELRNAENKLSAAIKEKELIYAKYTTTVNAIVSDNQIKITEFQARMQQWAAENGFKETIYTNTIQFVLTKYQADISTKIQHYQNQLAHSSLSINKSDSKIQGYVQSIALLNEQFANSVQSYINSIRNEKYMPAPIDPEVAI